MERCEIGRDDLLGNVPTSMEVKRKIDLTLHEISYNTARFVAVAGCLMYFALAPAHQFVLPRPLSTTMTFIAFGSLFAMAGVYFALSRRLIRVELASLVMVSLVGIYSINALAQMYLAQDIIQTTNILLVLVNAGYAFLFTRWYHVTVALVLGAWLIVFSTLPDKSNIVHFGFALGFATAAGYVIHFNRIRSVREQVHLRIQSDQLLLNTLPNSIAGRLKAGETMIADDHDVVTVLFADIVDFTPLSASMTPRELVVLLNQVF
jgi:Adenylate and Guanylate cyclase catalytic domain